MKPKRNKSVVPTNKGKRPPRKPVATPEAYSLEDLLWDMHTGRKHAN